MYPPNERRSRQAGDRLVNPPQNMLGALYAAILRDKLQKISKITFGIKRLDDERMSHRTSRRLGLVEAPLAAFGNDGFDVL